MTTFQELHWVLLNCDWKNNIKSKMNRYLKNEENKMNGLK